MVSLKNIGFIGCMGSGKTTMANLVSEHFGHRRVSFASGVREVKDMLFKDYPNEREILQKIGMSMRSISNDVWIKYLFSKLSEDKNYAIDDVRFINEVNYLITNGWLLFKLEVPTSERIRRLQKIGKFKDNFENLWHSSELEAFSISKDDYGDKIVFIDNTRPLDIVWEEIKSKILSKK